MRLPKPNLRPHDLAFRAAIPAFALLGLMLSGCASQSEYYAAEVVAMEDDGLPAQIPPLRRAKMAPDDPREPFSPNYGPPPSPVEENAETEANLPADLPPEFRRRLIRATIS